MLKKITLIIFICFIGLSLFAQRGKHGAKVVSTAGNIINEYTSLSVDANSGTSSISVVSSALNANNRFASTLQSGDLIMIIQIQGATIDFSLNNSTWGAISNINNCGNYEFAEVISVPNTTTINLSCPLQKSYTATGRVQVIRVPRYTSLLVNNGGEITSDTWNGSVGGIMAVEVLGDITISSGGKIDLTGKGFRGGILSEDDADWGIGDWIGLTGNMGGEKGEGIAGFQTDYDALGGRYCRAAPANGGGGANAHNAGGGGGANAGDIALWTGTGNPDISTPSWTTAWNMEAPNFANSTSTGGGKGGYTFSTSNQDALVIGPHEVSGVSVWGGDLRSNTGGYGGRPLDYSTGKVYMGGGGGSGDQNDLKGGSGGIGGGIVFVIGYGNLNGAGQVIANGANGINSTSGNGLTSSGADGAGGGGGGGAIVLNVTGLISGISASANGGVGGNQVINSYYNLNQSQAEGPGGGGGGGYIAISNGSITKTVNGGNNGTTNSSGLTEFTPNGATRGGAGINTGVVTNYAIVALNDTICSGESSILTASFVGTPPSGTSIVWYDAPVGGNVLATGSTYTTPILTSSATYYVGSCPGTFHTAVTVVVTTPIANAGSDLSVCSGGSVTLNGSGGVSYIWSPATTLNNPNIYNPVATPLTTTTYYLTITDAHGCHAVDSVKVTVGVLTANAGTDTSVCIGSGVQLLATGGTNYSWSPATGLSSTVIANPIASPTVSTSYIVTVSDGASCSDVDTVYVMVNPSVIASAGNNDTICPGNSLQLNASGGSVYQWLPVTDLSDPSISNPLASPAVTTTYTVTIQNAQGCSATDAVTITVMQLVDASFSAGSSCAYDTTYFINNSSCIGCTINSWDWDFGDSQSSVIEQPSHFYNTPGSYSATLVVQAANGCIDSVTQNITIYAVPDASFSIVGLPDCAPALGYFHDNSTNTNSWAWNFGDGLTSAIQNPSHPYNTAGTYTVSHTVVTPNGCSDSISQQVVVYPSPNALFTVLSTTVIAGTPVNFTNASTGATSWIWNFGDGNTSALQNPVNTFTSEGTYNVLLTVMDANGCTDTFSLTINVILEIDLEIPNVFTPNADGINDLLVFVNLEKAPDNKLLIFNRWGKQVFESNNYQNNWDGGNQKDGVYFYILTFLDKEYHGTISIER